MARQDGRVALLRNPRSAQESALPKCPIHKLMTTTEVVIETAPLEEAP